MKRKHPDTLSNLHAIFSQKLELRLREDINELLSGLGLKEKLDFLDQLDTEQSNLPLSEFTWLVDISHSV